MPWKNGLGSTAQIAIHPANAKFPDEPFVFRISSATVSAKNSFSQFPGYDRWLVVLTGDGLKVNDRLMRPLLPFHFNGEEEISCDLVKNPVTDLGVIYHREHCVAQMKMEILESQVVLNPQYDYHYIYCVDGSMYCGALHIDAGDTLFVNNKDGQLITPLQGHGQYVHITLRDVPTSSPA
jgi:environmental stress-induced protein Ves